MKRMVVCGVANTHSGYGQNCEHIIKDFTEMGYDVVFRPITADSAFGSKITGDMLKRMVWEVQPERDELLLHPPNYKVTPGKRTAYFTMWESSKLKDEAVRCLEKAAIVIVPCHWNAACFKESGVNCPIKVVPLGIDPILYQPRPMDLTGPCIFGAAGRLAHGATRKGVNKVIDLFLKAFPHEKDVRLRVKGMLDCKLTQTDDPRVLLWRTYLTDQEMADWYHSLTCFVSAAKGEGWGLHQHQAMACARPVIASAFGGLAEFMTTDNSLCVPYRMVDADWDYLGLGQWAEPDDDGMIAAMRQIYEDRDLARTMGRKAAISAHKLTWKNSNTALNEVLKQYNFFQ